MSQITRLLLALTIGRGAGLKPVRILLALVIGLTAGIVAAASGEVWTQSAVTVIEPIGDMWLNALRMTIVPLVVSLLVTGIAASAAAARASKLAGRSLLLFVSLLLLSAIIAALLTPLILSVFPMPTEAAAALREALTGTQSPGAAPTFEDFLRSIVPSNAIAAAAEDAILPLIVFTLVFAFAVTRLPEEPRERLVGFFKAIADTMLIVIGWVLWIAPIGIFALAFVLGARTGSEAFGALLHYVLVVTAVGVVIWLAAWPLAAIGGRVPFGRFTRAMIPPHVVAFGTRSSLASLPAMLRAAEELRVPVAASGVALPMAVALFRATGPAMNLAVAIYIAAWFGHELTWTQLAIGILAASTTTMGAVGIPGQASFVTSIAPICIAMGLPIEPLALLIAVEVLPDIMRTLGNVSMDVAATTTAARITGFTEADAQTQEDRLLEKAV